MGKALSLKTLNRHEAESSTVSQMYRSLPKSSSARTSWNSSKIRRVVPNGRRDDFEQNAHYTHLLSRLSANRVAAKSLVDRILARLGDGHKVQE